MSASGPTRRERPFATPERLGGPLAGGVYRFEGFLTPATPPQGG